jgi:hypothetical protein
VWRDGEVKLELWKEVKLTAAQVRVRSIGKFGCLGNGQRGLAMDSLQLLRCSGYHHSRSARKRRIVIVDFGALGQLERDVGSRGLVAR